MSKIHRIFSISNIYHIIIKGTDDNDIFYSNDDRQAFLERLKICTQKYKFQILAYCLMSNHVHLVIKVDKKFLSKSIQSLTIRYASYFNKKYDHKGPFVQNRFKSKNIENLDYFLKVCRYVHRNPEKAGIAKTFNYKWSSYNEYINEEKIINKHILMHYYNNNINDFIEYTNTYENIDEIENIADFELDSRIKDEDLVEIILRKFLLNSANEISSFFKDKNNRVELRKLKNINGLSISQISRVTRVNRASIKKILDN